MSKRLPPLNSLRAFEAASRHMSFQKAAEELNVTPSALSYQIRQLEDFLQIPLFVRLNRAIELTDSGQRVAPGIQDAFERLHETMARLRPSSPPHILTISTGPAFATKWLSPRLHKFLEQYPNIDIRISANLRLVDFRADEVDVAIRFGAGDYPGLHVEPLCDERVVPLASPRLIAAMGGKITAENLQRVTLIHDDTGKFLISRVTWAEWLKRARITNIDATRGPRFDHADHALDAAADGLGIVLGRLALAIGDIVSGRLVAPFDMMLRAKAGFYFCCLPEMLNEPKVQAIRTFLFEEILAEEATLAEFRKDKRDV